MLLHTLLLEKTQSSTLKLNSQRAKLCGRLRKSIRELYCSLVTYQMQCVCYCYRRNHIVRTLRALATLDDWKGKSILSTHSAAKWTPVCNFADYGF
jgi:hypothetical protein